MNLVSCFGSFVLAITSVFTYTRSEAGSSLLGGLGNASQVFVIFLSMLMVNEKEAQVARTQDIPLTEYTLDVSS